MSEPDPSQSVDVNDDLATFPLTGITVVDATTDFAGRMCARLLCDAGAAVVRVVSAGAPLSDWDTFVDQPVVRSAEEQRALMADASVLLCTSAERATELGFDAEATRSDQIFVRFPPFGAGPYEVLRGGEVVLSALCGLADCTPGYPDWQEGPIQPPIQSAARLAELGAATTCAMAIVAALVERMRGSTSPCAIEVSQLEAAAALMIFDWGPAAYADEAPGRRRNGRLLEPNCFIRCTDGYLVIVATNDAQWQSLAGAMGSPAWTSDDRFATIMGRAEYRDDLHHLIKSWALDNSGRQLAAAAQTAGVPCAFVLSLEEAIGSEQVTALGSMDHGTGHVLPGDPVVRNRKRRPRYAPRTRSDEPAWFAGGAARFEKPLSGIRVLDLSQLLAGPLAGQYLASLGAEVVLVESRRYPTPRMYGPFVGEPTYDGSSNFNHANRGKHSVEVDLKTAEGKEILRQLVGKSDVVLENLSRRAANNLGITYELLRKERPDLVLASISAFGRTGPWGGYTANHAGVAALSGLAAATRGPRGEPHLAGGVMPDVLTGAYMALAILQALGARALTGRGAHVEVSMLEVVLNAIGGLIPSAARGEATTVGTLAEFYEAPGGDAYISVATPHDRARVMELIGGSASAADAMSILQASGIPAAVVQDMLNVIADPQLNARGFVQQIEHPVAGTRAAPGVPWIYEGVRPALGAAPVLGSHTETVMSELLDMPAEEYRRLRESGVLR